MSEKNYYRILQQLKADTKKTELIITEGPEAGSKALVIAEISNADSRALPSGFQIAACTGPESAREFFKRVILACGSAVFQGTGEFFFEERKVFYEQLEKKPRLVICGAGHVGLAICRIASITGLETVVIDDRPEYSSQAQQAGAAQVICAPFETALASIRSDSRTCFVLVTRGHAHGMECLRMILRKPRLYAGMMSSKKRADAAAQTLLQEGFSAEEVAGVHMPVGLKIGAETPGEIAVSVMAQIISVIRGQGAGDGYLPEIMDAITACIFSEKITDSGASAVLAIIVQKSGEAPREPGTRMLILADGTIRGSIGGGYAEAEIVKAAKQMMQDPSSPAAFVKVEMPLVKSGTEDYTASGTLQNNNYLSDESMICGGKITVLLELLEQ